MKVDEGTYLVVEIVYFLIGVKFQMYILLSKTHQTIWLK